MILSLLSLDSPNKIVITVRVSTKMFCFLSQDVRACQKASVHLQSKEIDVRGIQLPFNKNFIKVKQSFQI